MDGHRSHGKSYQSAEETIVQNVVADLSIMQQLRKERDGRRVPVRKIQTATMGSATPPDLTCLRLRSLALDMRVSEMQNQLSNEMEKSGHNRASRGATAGERTETIPVDRRKTKR